MSPLTSVVTAGGEVYMRPFVGPVDHTAPITLDISGLTNDEVDADGYLKPGTPFLKTGVLVSAPAQEIFGVSIEAEKVADGNAAGDLSGGTDRQIALAVICVVVQERMEANLGRVLTADEISALNAAGSIVLIE